MSIGVASARGKLLIHTLGTSESFDDLFSANPAPPEMMDIGIFVSTNPVALDKACVDAVYNSPDDGKEKIISRMESRNVMLTVESAEKLGLGSKEYDFVYVWNMR